MLLHYLNVWFIEASFYLGRGHYARWNPCVTDMLRVDFGSLHVGLEAKPLAHRRQLLLVDGVCFAGTFARLTRFPASQIQMCFNKILNDYHL